MSYSLKKTLLAHQASLRTELTGLIVAKSTSPGLLVLFAHWGDKKINSMIATSQLGKILCTYQSKPRGGGGGGAGKGWGFDKF